MVTNSNTNYTKKAFNGVIIIFAFSLIGSLSGLFSRMFLTRKLSLEDFGLFFAVFALIQFFEIFRSMGIGTGLVKFISEFKALNKHEEIKKIVLIASSIILSISLVITVILLIFSKFLSKNYFKSEISFWLIIILAIWYFIRGIQDMIFTIFYGLQKMFFYGLRELRSILYLVTIAILFYFNDKVIIAAYGWLISSLIIVLIFFPLLLRHVNLFNVSLKGVKKMGKKLVRFSFPIFLSEVAETFLGNTDILILTYFVSMSEVGVYSAILPLAFMLYRISITFVTVGFPISTHLWTKKEYERLKQGIHSMYKYLMIMIIPVVTFMFIFSIELITVLYGAEYVIGKNILKIILIAVTSGALFHVTNSIIVSIGYPKIVTRSVIIGSVTNIIINISLIPFYGIYGAAFATLFSYVLMFIISFRFLREKIEFNLPTTIWFKMLLGSVIIYFIVNQLKSYFTFSLYIELAIFFLLGIILYSIWIFITGIVTKKEVHDIVHTFKVKI